MSEANVKTYEIGGKTYEQRLLVFGQWQQLNRIIEGVKMPAELSQRNLVVAFSDRLDQILAVILTEQGESARGKNLPELAELLAFEMSPEKVAEVIADFFDCNPIASVLNLVVGVIDKIQQTMKTAATGSSNQSSSSQAETGPNATVSSGDAHQQQPEAG